MNRDNLKNSLLHEFMSKTKGYESLSPSDYDEDALLNAAYNLTEDESVHLHENSERQTIVLYNENRRLRQKIQDLLKLNKKANSELIETKSWLDNALREKNESDLRCDESELYKVEITKTNESLSDENIRLRDEVNSMRQSISEINDQNNLLSHNLAEANKRAFEADRLHEMYAQVLKERDEARKGVRNALHDVEHLTNERTLLCEEIANLKKRLDHAQMETAIKPESAADSANVKSGIVCNGERDYNSLGNRIGELKEKLDITIKEKCELEKKLSLSQSEAVDAVTVYKKMEVEFKGLLTQFDDVMTYTEKQVKEKRDAERRAELLQRKIVEKDQLLDANAIRLTELADHFNQLLTITEKIMKEKSDLE